jgi:hypothetical protein
MKPEYDFSNGERGKFYFPDAGFLFPEEAAEEEADLHTSEEAAEEDYKEWLLFSMMMFAQHFNEDEPEYPLDLIKEKNPDYEGDTP